MPLRDKVEWTPALASGITALILAWAIPPRASAQQSPTTPPPFVFEHVTVVDVEHGERLRDQRVVLVGNRIQAVGAVGAVRAPAGARVVNARGKYLIPGLWDMHVHPLRQVAIMYPLFIANGVTGVRDAASTVPLDTLTQWKREILAGARVGPRLVVSGPALNSNMDGRKAHWLGVKSPASARRAVDSLQAAGADMIKTYVDSREIYFAIADEARRRGIPFGGHLPAYTGGLEASDSGARIIDHRVYLPGDLCGYLGPYSDSANAEQCAAAAQRFRHNDTWITRTPAVTRLFTPFYYSLRRQYLPGPDVEELDPHPVPNPPRPTSSADWAQELARFYERAKGGPPRDEGVTGFSYAMAERAGIPTLAATDAGPFCYFLCPPLPGFGLHDVLAVFVAGGMTPLGALQSATLNPARALHASDSLGTVAPGKLADLVLLDGDPLEDITNTTTIRAVVANGRYFDRAALDQLLVEARARAKAVPPPAP